jgi:hypothetical protein
MQTKSTTPLKQGRAAVADAGVADQIRVTGGFRQGKNMFKNNDIAEVREITDTEFVLNDGRRMRKVDSPPYSGAI